MGKKYKKKFTQKSPKISCSVKKKRDSSWYIIYEIPLELSEEALEYHLQETIGPDFMMRKEWYEKGGRMRKHYGELTGSKEKIKERNKVIKEIWDQAEKKGVSKLLIPDIINKELHKRKLLPKDKELSDRQIRRIVKTP
jgi:hypothetical protein